MDIQYSPTRQKNDQQRVIVIKKKYVIKGVRKIKKYNNIKKL